MYDLKKYNPKNLKCVIKIFKNNISKLYWKKKLYTAIDKIKNLQNCRPLNYFFLYKSIKNNYNKNVLLLLKFWNVLTSRIIRLMNY